MSLFRYPFKRLKKRAQLALSSFYTAWGGYKKSQPCGWLFYTLWRGLLEGIKKEPNLRWVLFIPFEKVEKKDSSFDEPFLYRFGRLQKKTDFSVDLFYTFYRGLLVGNEKGLLRSKPFPYTPKRFRTAVAGMKIPSPGPLDDRGVLCEDKYRIL